MNKFLFSFIVILALGLASCETDIDVNAEYEDIPIVYAAISPLDSNHYIKINRAFLGATSALDLAADASNFTYPDGELIVTVEEHFNGGIINTYTTADNSMVRKINEVPKDPGIFDNNTNVLYRFTDPNLNDLTPINRRLSTWKLKVVNTKLDKEITAQTEIVGPTTVANPTTQGKMQLWNGPVSTIDGFRDVTIRVNAGTDVGRVNVTVLFNYIEHYTTASGLSPVNKTVEMNLGDKRTTTTQGDALEWELKGAAFFDNIIQDVPANVPFLSHRELGNISLEIDIAGSELSTFMTVSAPSTTVNQDKPNYTNITNGIGVFSSREKYIWLSTVNPATGNINMQNATIEYLNSMGLDFCFGNSPTSGFMCNQQ